MTFLMCCDFPVYDYFLFFQLFLEIADFKFRESGKFFAAEHGGGCTGGSYEKVFVKSKEA